MAATETPSLGGRLIVIFPVSESAEGSGPLDKRLEAGALGAHRVLARRDSGNNLRDETFWVLD